MEFDVLAQRIEAQTGRLTGEADEHEHRDVLDGAGVGIREVMDFVGTGGTRSFSEGLGSVCRLDPGRSVLCEVRKDHGGAPEGLAGRGGLGEIIVCPVCA